MPAPTRKSRPPFLSAPTMISTPCAMRSRSRCTADTTRRSSVVMRSMMSSDRHLVDAERRGVDGFSRKVLPLRVIRHAYVPRARSSNAVSVAGTAARSQSRHATIVARCAACRAAMIAHGDCPQSRGAAHAPLHGRQAAGYLRHLEVERRVPTNTLEAYARDLLRLAAFAAAGETAGRGAVARRISRHSSGRRWSRDWSPASTARLVVGRARLLPVPAGERARWRQNPAGGTRAPRARSPALPRFLSTSRKWTRCWPRRRWTRPGACATARSSKCCTRRACASPNS